MTLPGAEGCDQLVDDGGDATLLTHKGKESEGKFAKDCSLSDPYSTTNPSSSASCSRQVLANGLGLQRRVLGDDDGHAPPEGDGR
jgi:hypothetical protein